MDLDAAAERLQGRVYRKVLKDPSGRARIVGRSVRAVRGQAIRAGAKSIDRRRRAPTVEQHDARQLERRIRNLQLAGVEVLRVGDRWKRRRTSDGKFVDVATESELIARRVAYGERQAIDSARAYARRLKVDFPKRGRPRDWSRLDPRLYNLYAKRVAMESSRVAHDALVDAFRDAALDRCEDLGVGWVRQVQRNACGACLGLADGVVHHSRDRRFYRHPRCRCIPVPARRGRMPKTGQQIFDSLTRDQQDALFHGRGGEYKAEMLRTGAVRLQDLVQIARERVDRTDYVVTETPLEGLVAATD